MIRVHHIFGLWLPLTHLIVLPDVLVLVPVRQILLQFRRARTHAVHHLHYNLQGILVIADHVVERRSRDLSSHDGQRLD